MNYDLQYDGQVVTWKGKGSFKATSGLPGSQNPQYQCTPDSGPVPEGYYKVFIRDQGAAADDGRGLCAIKPSWGIQKIPRGKVAGECEPYWANWGKNRARMEPANESTKLKCKPIVRGGFYLHDSTKGFSHGCIEVDTKIFSLFRDFSKMSKKDTLILKVQYMVGRDTNGGTKI